MSAQVGRIVRYIFTIEVRVCQCRGHAKEFATGKKPENVILIAQGYWNTYLAFYGDQMMWLNFSVVNTVDGTVIWRNGRREKEEEHDAT